MKPTQSEIREVLDICFEVECEEREGLWGMSYEQGVQAAIEWMQGDGDNPFE